MKVGKRGQVTIPEDIRKRFSIGPATDVEFSVENGEIVLRKVSIRRALRKWKGYCGSRFRELGFARVDDYVNAVRGR